MNNTQKELNSFAYDLVIGYCKSEGNSYSININNIPDHDLNKLCSLILANSPDFKSEILGPDNIYYDQKIFNYLINYLKDSDNKEKSESFLDSVQRGTRIYLYHNMCQILDEQLENFIYHNKYDVA